MRKYWIPVIGLILAIGLAIGCASIFSWFRGGVVSNLVAASHVQGNLPEKDDFRRFLVRDLAAYLKPKYGDKITFDYGFLREGPTQTGIGFPYYYPWLSGTNLDGTTIKAAVEVAAMYKTQFNVTAFVPRQEITAHPEALRDVFPERLIQSIRDKAKN